MDAQAEEVAAFAGEVAAIRFPPVEMTTADPNVVTDWHGATIHDVLATTVHLLGRFAQEVEEALPEVFGNRVQAAIKAAFAEHVRNIAVRAQEVTTMLKAPAKYVGSHQGSGHDLGRTHVHTGVIHKPARFQKLVTQTVNCDNAFLHGCPLRHGLS